MVDLSIFAWITDRVIDWRRYSLNTKKEAIAALTPAVAATVLYTTRRRQGSPQDKNQEGELYQLWFKASIDLKRYDLELSNVCKDKSEYWLSPESWQEHKIDELNIRLTILQAALNQIAYV